jgi:hypothetical protein
MGEGPPRRDSEGRATAPFLVPRQDPGTRVAAVRFGPVMRQVPAMRVSERLEAAGFVRSDWPWESDLPNQALQPHGAGNALGETEMGSEHTLALL